MKKTQAVSATINRDTIEKTKELAVKEKRSFSQMINILIELGIKYFRNEHK